FQPEFSQNFAWIEYKLVRHNKFQSILSLRFFRRLVCRPRLFFELQYISFSEELCHFSGFESPRFLFSAAYKPVQEIKESSGSLLFSPAGVQLCFQLQSLSCEAMPHRRRAIQGHHQSFLFQRQQAAVGPGTAKLKWPSDGQFRSDTGLEKLLGKRTYEVYKRH